jgi:hypothetical protein
MGGEQVEPGRHVAPHDPAGVDRPVLEQAREAVVTTLGDHAERPAEAVLRVHVDGEHPAGTGECGGEVRRDRRLANTTLGGAHGEPHAGECGSAGAVFRGSRAPVCGFPPHAPHRAQAYRQAWSIPSVRRP